MALREVGDARVLLRVEARVRATPLDDRVRVRVRDVHQLLVLLRTQSWRVGDDGYVRHVRGRLSRPANEYMGPDHVRGSVQIHDDDLGPTSVLPV